MLTKKAHCLRYDCISNECGRCVEMKLIIASGTFCSARLRRRDVLKAESTRTRRRGRVLRFLRSTFR